MVSMGVLFRVSMMFLKRNKQELYTERDKFGDHETVINHKTKVGKLLEYPVKQKDLTRRAIQVLGKAFRT